MTHSVILVKLVRSDLEVVNLVWLDIARHLLHLLLALLGPLLSPVYLASPKRFFVLAFALTLFSLLLPVVLLAF